MTVMTLPHSDQICKTDIGDRVAGSNSGVMTLLELSLQTTGNHSIDDGLIAWLGLSLQCRVEKEWALLRLPC